MNQPLNKDSQQDIVGLLTQNGASWRYRLDHLFNAEATNSSEGRLHFLPESGNDFRKKTSWIKRIINRIRSFFSKFFKPDFASKQENIALQTFSSGPNFDAEMIMSDLEEAQPNTAVLGKIFYQLSQNTSESDAYKKIVRIQLADYAKTRFDDPWDRVKQAQQTFSDVALAQELINVDSAVLECLEKGSDVMLEGFQQQLFDVIMILMLQKYVYGPTVDCEATQRYTELIGMLNQSEETTLFKRNIDKTRYDDYLVAHPQSSLSAALSLLCDHDFHLTSMLKTIQNDSASDFTDDILDFYQRAWQSILEEETCPLEQIKRLLSSAIDTYGLNIHTLKDCYDEHRTLKGSDQTSPILDRNQQKLEELTMRSRNLMRQFQVTQAYAKHSQVDQFAIALNELASASESQTHSKR